MMNDYSLPVKLNQNEIYFLPLGGSGEIGMNLNLYHYRGKWLMVDMGITFDNIPGIEVILPDIRFIEEHAADLVGLILTHAHEDHIGAVPYLWPRLKCPIYTTPFTAALVKNKFHKLGLQPAIHEVPLSGRIDIQPFDVEFIRLTHSVPEPNALAIRTGAGIVVHTGDWKIDPDPLIGEPVDEETLLKIGDEGTLALVCDSTNVFVPGRSGSEKQIQSNLIELVGQFPDQRIVIVCFASNVARVASCIKAAHVHQRQIALVGRSLEQVDQAARAIGYFTEKSPFLKGHEVATLPRNQVLIISTGSQGEHRSALAKIARGEDKHIQLQEGDVVIFSAREIPGNEEAIRRMQNDLSQRGVKIITAEDENVHVSGHPCRDELHQMYKWVRPKILVPVHGEPKHLAEHGRFGYENNIPEVVVPQNGSLIRLAPGSAEVIYQIPCAPEALDGSRILPLVGEVMHDRHRLMATGHVVVTIIIKQNKRLEISSRVLLVGIADEKDIHWLTEECIELSEKACLALPSPQVQDDEKIQEAARIAVRRRLFAYYGKKALTHVQVIRI